MEEPFAPQGFRKSRLAASRHGKIGGIERHEVEHRVGRFDRSEPRLHAVRQIEAARLGSRAIAMVGAFALDLYKNRDALSFDDVGLIAAGFIAAFIAGIFVVRSLLDFVSHRGFTPFAIWRILVGTAGLVGLWLLG